MTELNLKIGNEYVWKFPNGTPARVRLLRMLEAQAPAAERHAHPGIDERKQSCKVEIITPEWECGRKRTVDPAELRQIEESH